MYCETDCSTLCPSQCSIGTKQPSNILQVSLCLHTPDLLSAEPEAAHLQACLNERPGEGLGEVVGGLRGVMEAEALQLNAETQALHNLKVLQPSNSWLDLCTPACCFIDQSLD